MRVRGTEVRIRPAGRSTWEPLDGDRGLSAGDEVDAGRGAIELLLAGESEPGPAEVGNRLALAPGARLTVGPLDDPAQARLEEGASFAAADPELNLRAGGCLLTVKAGDAGLELNRRGDLAVRMHQGAASLEGAGGRQELQAGFQGGHLAKGKLARVRALTAKLPRWL